MKFYSKIVLLLLAASVATTTAFAQTFQTADNLLEERDGPENANRDANGKYQRSGYITNPWYDNWSFGLAGGIQSLTGNHNGTVIVTPAGEFNITKWVTPSIAARFGVQAGTLREHHGFQVRDHYILKHEDGVNFFNETYLHADLMWNISAAIWGYKETRLITVTPYLHAGYLRLVHPDKSIFDNEYLDKEVEFGAGLYNRIRMGDHLELTADLRCGAFSGRYHDNARGGVVFHPSLSVGLAYTLHKWYWRRTSSYVSPLVTSYDLAQEAYNEANDARNKLAQDNDKLQKQIDDLRSKPQTDTVYVNKYDNDELLRRVAASPCVIYYEINSPKILGTEAVRIDKYVRETCAKDPYHVFYITGSADEGTGNDTINARLSKQRANGVKKYLKNKFRIPDSQIVIKATIISHEHEDGRLDRCVLFENE